MGRNFTRAIAFVLVTLCLISGATPFLFAQQPQPAKPAPARELPLANDQESEKIFTRRVRLPITVTDKKGQFVSGLSQNDFLILEDRVPQSIESFDDEQSNKLPLYIAVLMDTSPS